MYLSGWRLFGWPDLKRWIRRDLQDWMFMWRDLKGETENYKIALQDWMFVWRDLKGETENYKIALVYEMEIRKYLWLWKLQNTYLSRFRVCLVHCNMLIGAPLYLFIFLHFQTIFLILNFKNAKIILNNKKNHIFL